VSPQKKPVLFFQKFPERHHATLGLIFFILFLIPPLFVGWVNEDALITLRVVDNFLNGFGLRWNVDERVQVYTHPLWMLSLIPFAAITNHVDTIFLFPSLLCLIGIGYFTWRFSGRNVWLFGFLLCLLSARSVRDFMVSGLENPMTVLWLTAFLYSWLYPRSKKIEWFRLALFASLAALTRLDAVLFFLPVAAYLLYTRFPSIMWRKVLLGVSPLLAWFCFAFLYYGFFLPNTYWSKVSSHFPLSDYLAQGDVYALDLVLFSPLTALGILLGLCLTAVMVGRRWHIPHVLLAAGAALYVAYVFRIGGDYMSGRFWGAPYVVFAFVFSDLLRRHYHAATQGTKTVMICVITLVASIDMLSAPKPFRLTQDVVDERIIRTASCMFCRWKTPLHLQSWAQEGMRDKQQAEKQRVEGNKERLIKIEGSIGSKGYFAGPDVIIIDFLGLPDALVARLPVLGKLRIGHVLRHPPEDYVAARRTGNTDAMHPDLREYYKAIRTITSAPVFDVNRLKTVIKFQLGHYDPFLAAYVKILKPGTDRVDPKK
jgi:arabinofuranosyltransferase